MSNSKTVLFICTGNTCRSPMAEGLLKASIKGDSNIRVISAGVAAMPGQLVSRETQEILSENGGALKEFESQQVDEVLLKEADLVIAMTSAHADRVRRFFSAHVGEVNLLCDYIDPSEGLAGVDIPDPIGMGKAAYEEVAEVMALAMPGIIEAIK
jgi:protein-tyrosine-phosphatase